MQISAPSADFSSENKIAQCGKQSIIFLLIFDQTVIYIDKFGEGIFIKGLSVLQLHLFFFLVTA